MSTDKVQLRDSVLKHHFNEVAGLPKFDTTTLEHHLLKALYANDTNYLASYFRDLPEQEEWRVMKLYFDSGFHLPPLHTLKVDKAYRFTTEYYGFSLAYDTTLVDLFSITISKKGDSVNLQGVWAQYFWDPKEQEKAYINFKFRKDTALEVKHWDTLQQELEYCDYWGLKQNNDSKGKDGSATTVEGYIRGYFYGRPDRSHYVYRFAADRYALKRPLEYVERLSGRLPNIAKRFH